MSSASPTDRRPFPDVTTLAPRPAPVTPTAARHTAMSARLLPGKQHDAPQYRVTQGNSLHPMTNLALFTFCEITNPRCAGAGAERRAGIDRGRRGVPDHRRHRRGARG